MKYERVIVTGPACVLKTTSVTEYNKLRGTLDPPGHLNDYSEDIGRNPVWKLKNENPIIDILYCALKTQICLNSGLFDRGWFDNVVYKWIFQSNSIVDLEFDDSLKSAFSEFIHSIPQNKQRFIIVMPELKCDNDVVNFMHFMNMRNNKIDRIEKWYIIRQIAGFINLIDLFNVAGFDCDVHIHDIYNKGVTSQFIPKYAHSLLTGSQIEEYPLCGKEAIGILKENLKCITK